MSRTMIDHQLVAEVAELMFREARLLDDQRWSDWLALYCQDAVFWVPAFRMDGSYTRDPKTELNMIFIEGRTGLDRYVRHRAVEG